MPVGCHHDDGRAGMLDKGGQEDVPVPADSISRMSAH